MNYNEKAELAKTLYLSTDKSQKSICEMVHCSQKTFIAWKKKGNWSKLNAVKMLTQGQVADVLKGQLILLAANASDEQRLLNASEIDSVSKLTSSISKIESGISMATILEVFKNFNKWLVVNDAAAARLIVKHQDAYVKDLTSGK